MSYFAQHFDMAAHHCAEIFDTDTHKCALQLNAVRRTRMQQRGTTRTTMPLLHCYLMQTISINCHA